jgi:hypothetical protein
LINDVHNVRRLLSIKRFKLDGDGDEATNNWWFIT